MTMEILRIVFVALLCLPMLILIVHLFGKLLDEYIFLGKEKKEKEERQRLAEEQQRRRRRGAY